MSKDKMHKGRRAFLKTGAAVGAGAAAAAALPGAVQANNHPHPFAGSMTELDYNTYTKGVEIVEHFNFPREGGGNLRVAGKAQLMAKGNRRLLFQGGNVYDISEPRKVSLVKAGAFEGGQIQLAYNRSVKKWLLIAGSGAPNSSVTPTALRGKWDDPSLIDRAVNWKGLRGVRIYDATDPENVQLMSEWACDQGDPSREVQEGQGTHRNFYQGGRYAYLDTAPDNTWTNMENGVRPYTFGIQTIDLADPMKPKFVSNWGFPGQRNTEMDEYRKWRQYGDKTSWTSTHGPMVVPVNVEDGGKYGYTAYGSFGVTVHDCSDPANPKLVGHFDPLPQPGGIPFHTVDTSRVDKGIILGTPETLSPDCNEPWMDSYVIDVSDPTNPRPLARLPRPMPPPEAPYETFCQKRGRTGVHNPPHVHAPGKVHPNLTFLACFNGGIQVYDLTEPSRPRNPGYFVPPSGGSLDRPGSWNRDTDNVLVEWDRNLIWAFTNSGMYLLSYPDLGAPNFEPKTVTEWVHEGMNRGHDEA